MKTICHRIASHLVYLFLINPLLFLGLASDTSTARAQSPGTFTVASTMTTARSQHTATLLTDGRVLFAGGAENSTVLASAEICDPSSGTFTSTGNMTTARVAHIATSLADGRVLIVGDNTAELYDPSTGTYTATGNMTMRHGCNMALLKTGKVLIVDDSPPFGSLPTAVLYDPDTGTFAPTGMYASIEMAQLDHALFPSYGGSDCPRATPLANGRVLVAGGAFAELYDSDTDTFSTTGTKITLNGFVKTLPQGWLDPSSATLLLNSTVLFDGGDGDLGPASGAWIYDPSSGTFSATGSMTTPRYAGTITLLPDGSVLMASSYRVGGFSNSLNPGAVASAEVYDPGTGAFTATHDMTMSRFGQTATLLNSGKVLVTGGISGDYPGYLYVSSAEIYTPSVLVASPILFSLSGDGRGQGSIWHAATGETVSASSPASTGEALSMYAAGLSFSQVVPPQVAVGSRLAEVLYFGGAPGYPGYNQVNFRTPSSVSPGPAVPVRLIYLRRSSNEVSIGVQ